MDAEIGGHGPNEMKQSQKNGKNGQDHRKAFSALIKGV
jgi:hypothetical protein